MLIDLCEHKLELLPEKALYLPALRTMVVADVHLGKASHMRKEGVAMPALAQLPDYARLQHLITLRPTERMYFLGDLFHSATHSDWPLFQAFISQHTHIDFTLIIGNHDRIPPGRFEQIGVATTLQLRHGQLIFTHDEITDLPPDCVNIVGHIHPGISLSGRARQSITLPCFYHRHPTFILPAFGILTGLYKLPIKEANNVYIITEQAIHKL